MGLLDAPGKPPLLRGSSIAFLGDSITAGSIGTYNYADAFPLYAVLTSGGKLISVGYHGQSGDTSTGGLTRISTALAKKPTYLSILYGTNDIGQGVQASQTDSQIIASLAANLTSLYRQTKAVGTVPVLGTIPPQNAGQNSQRTRCNVKAGIWIRRHAIINGYPLIDYWTLWRKDGIAETPAGNWKTIYALDGTHPNPKGGGAAGTLMSQGLTSLAPSAMPPLCTDLASTDGSVYLAPNVLWQSNSAAPGVRPDNCSSLGAAFSNTHTVYSLVTDSVMPGNVLQIAMDSSANTAGGLSTQSTVTTTAGNIIAVGGYFTTDGVVSVQAQAVIGSTTYRPMNISAGTAITQGIYYMEFPAPASGAISVQLLTGTPSGTPATVRFSYPTVIDLTSAIGETTAIAPG